MTVYTEGCAKCGTEDTGRFTDGDDVCLDCRSTQPDEKSPCCKASIVWAAELVPFMDWHLVCSECQDLFYPCVDCKSLVRYESDNDRYVHLLEIPPGGCFLSGAYRRVVGYDIVDGEGRSIEPSYIVWRRVEPTKGGHMAVDGEPYFPLPISFTTGCDVCNDGGNCRCT